MDHDEAASAARLLTVVERAVSDRLRAALVPWELDLEEWRVLSLLSDGEGHTMAETAEFALLAPPTLTKAVNRLVSNNLVHRRTGTVDRRQVLIRSTVRGQAKYDEASPVMDAAAAAVFPSASDRELLQTLLRALETNAKASSVSL
ncbi:MarR family transcriptional regulator [Rhodococcus sp. 14-2483-1-1]|uniref:MarR family winged helix-turn-helix transcriptional regulator n=1 Tax=Nocardiaceae TaxID=85025 RepID=UPI00050C458A|nr:MULTISPECIES: MarR family winged helix-turn-helix transcriptional regulator [Rhodococcus]OZF39268.1 MarR family transcriptional regulator [Rhodococcus sp. 14-2483-1-1]QII08248.1 winged helix-turn-helix transcriptional regulator [Rhodococcus fascians A25f]